jgi:hypothetical protein
MTKILEKVFYYKNVYTNEESIEKNVREKNQDKEGKKI